jgi:aldehyde:ferredoxin oxidoreductase
LSAVTGWDVDAEELEATARRIVLAKRAFNAREGWTRADDGLPERFLSEPLEVSSGRSAALTREQLDGMIEAYYAARGLDVCGIPRPDQIEDLRLGVAVR